MRWADGVWDACAVENCLRLRKEKVQRFCDASAYEDGCRRSIRFAVDCTDPKSDFLSVSRLARLVRIDPEHITTAEAQFQRWGVGAVLLGRMIPGGVGAYALCHFLNGHVLIATFAGTYLWCTLLI